MRDERVVKVSEMLDRITVTLTGLFGEVYLAESSFLLLVRPGSHNGHITVTSKNVDVASVASSSTGPRLRSSPMCRNPPNMALHKRQKHTDRLAAKKRRNTVRPIAPARTVPNTRPSNDWGGRMAVPKSDHVGVAGQTPSKARSP